MVDKYVDVGERRKQTDSHNNKQNQWRCVRGDDSVYKTMDVRWKIINRV